MYMCICVYIYIYTHIISCFLAACRKEANNSFFPRRLPVPSNRRARLISNFCVFPTIWSTSFWSIFSSNFSKYFPNNPQRALLR